MRRLIIAIVAASLVAVPETGRAQDSAGGKTGAEFCQEYCGEKAAERCEDIDSFRCGAYILGCLAGCNLKQL